MTIPELMQRATDEKLDVRHLCTEVGVDYTDILTRIYGLFGNYGQSTSLDVVGILAWGMAIGYYAAMERSK